MVITRGVGPLIVMLRSCVSVCPVPSRTSTVNALVPVRVGLPLTMVDWTPKLSAIVSPLGSCPDMILNLCGLPDPPLEVMKAE